VAAPRSFGESFRLHEAVQIIVTTAARAGSPVCGPTAVSALAGTFSGFTQAELEAILSRTAMEHDVTVTAAAHAASPAEAKGI
jgi:hypothetical protein